MDCNFLEYTYKQTHYINHDYCITSQSINPSLDNYNELCADIALVECRILVRICVQRVECMRFSPLASSNWPRTHACTRALWRHVQTRCYNSDLLTIKTATGISFQIQLKIPQKSKKVNRIITNILSLAWTSRLSHFGESETKVCPVLP
jgi:hypothetical protein